MSLSPWLVIEMVDIQRERYYMLVATIIIDASCCEKRDTNCIELIKYVVVVEKSY
jgi:hypothetical protein